MPPDILASGTIPMENETMDSNSKITLELNPYIVDLSSKSVKSCLADNAQLNLQNVSNSSTTTANVDNNFASHNGCTNSDHHETRELMNGNKTYEKCDVSNCDSPTKTNSSQCNLSFPSDSECSNLESQLSSLSIDTNTADPKLITESHQFSVSKKCDNEGLSSESVSERTNSRSSEPNDICTIQETNVNSICNSETEKEDTSASEIMYISYESEHQMPDIMKLIQKDLSEPYSIYTYRYFIHNWPHLCFLAVCKGKSVGAIVCKLDLHRKIIKRGYIAMLAVDECHRKQGIGSNLVLKAIRVMVAEGADEVVLETEITNQPALRLYENLGFVRDKRLFRYYLNGVDALRLKLWLR